MPVILQADHRETRSGIPRLLCENAGLSVTLATLPVGDYIINSCIGVERKTAEDFVQNIISNRLFDQISRLKRSIAQPLLLIEGNPYSTNHHICESAVRNAILSIMLAWQIPVLFSKDKNNTAAILGMIALQEQKAILPVRGPQIYRPKRILGKKLFLLQSIPGVGAALAMRLLQKFKNIRAVINASEKELRETEGIGRLKARAIIKFMDEEENTQ